MATVIAQHQSRFRAPAEKRRQSKLLTKCDGFCTRIFDVTVAFWALVILLPLIVVVAVIVKASSRGPILFAHTRLGRDGREFKCLKFRTMVHNGDDVLRRHLGVNPAARAEWSRNFKLRTDPRVTPLGTFLRRSSMDELPQLLNVLAGSMSIVGPRPIVQAEVQRYGRYIADYKAVKPGLTGLWQISGRNNLTYRRRVAMDTAYARERNLLKDMRICLLTVPAVLLARGSC